VDSRIQVGYRTPEGIYLDLRESILNRAILLMKQAGKIHLKQSQFLSRHWGLL